MTQAGGSSSGLTGSEELTEFQGRAFLALTDMPPSMEEIDLLLPLASIPGPNLSPRQHCCVQQDATTSLILASAGEQPGSSALLPSSQKPLTSLALLPRPPKPWSWGQPCSAGSYGANHQPAAGWLLPPPLPSLPELQEQGQGMQNATEDQRGLLKCWALAAIPAGSASKGICPLHPAVLMTLILLQDSQGTALPRTSTPGTPQAPRARHRPGEHGRRKEGSEPRVEVEPTSV